VRKARLQLDRSQERAKAASATTNTTTLADETLAYDGSDRHLTTATDGTSVSYLREVTDRIVSQATTTAWG
jgi:hypothetical protein